MDGIDGGLILALLAGIIAGFIVGIGLGRWTRQGEIRLLRERSAEIDAGRDRDRSLTELLNALDRRVLELDQKADQADRGRREADAAIREQIHAMQENSQNLVSETKRLTNTLSNAAQRGRYGEMQLEQLLSHSGLRLDVHFRKQARNDDGRIPDFTVLLPGGGTLFIDAKFPFDNFWKAANSESTGEKQALLAGHVQDLVKHADELVKRAYHDKETSPDFVVLFLPFESILSIALDVDSQLLERLFSKNVIPATPTTMLALLRTIGYGYSQRDMATNTATIRDLAVTLLQRIGLLHTRLERMGKQLRTVARTYGSLVQSVESHLFVPARKMSALGVPSAKALSSIDTEIPLRDFQALHGVEDVEIEADDLELDGWDEDEQVESDVIKEQT